MDKIRLLLWAYLWLLIFEGALRKWIVPALDAPLLLIRDPVVLWIYYEAFRNRLSFTNNAFFFPNLIIGGCTTLLSLAVGNGNLLVTYFGFHTDFLQIPLIFLMPQFLDRSDVIKIGRYLLYLMLPMAALVIYQFRADPDSWVNKGAIHTWYGTVRPSGTFSYIAGLVAYIATVASFLLYGYLQLRTYNIMLIATATVALLLSTFCSGSRTCIVTVGIVVVAMVFCVVIRGKGGLGLMVAALLIALVVPFLSMLPVFKDGTDQLTRRFKDAAAGGEDTSGMVNRYAETMEEPLVVSGDEPLFGHGIGIGTNAAAGMLKGDREFIGPEDEWGRLFFECGPIFGLLLVIFRVSLTLAVAKAAYDALKRDNMLPMLIFAGCGVSILNGQWGVPTSLGFAIIGAGLALSACNEPEEDEDEYDEEHDGEEDEHADDESDHSTHADTTA